MLSPNSLPTFDLPDAATHTDSAQGHVRPVIRERWIASHLRVGTRMDSSGEPDPAVLLPERVEPWTRP